MVDLLVYTNHRIGDMYYNRRAQHRKRSIYIVLKYWGVKKQKEDNIRVSRRGE